MRGAQLVKLITKNRESGTIKTLRSSEFDYSATVAMSRFG
jgi:hypothetical protein